MRPPRPLNSRPEKREPAPPVLTDSGDSLFFNVRGTRVRSVVLVWFWRLYLEKLSPAGRWFLWTSVAFTVYGGSTLDIQAYIVFCYAFGLWAVAFLSMVLARPRIALKTQHADRVCAGEVLPVEAHVLREPGLPPIDVRVVPHRLSRSIEPGPEGGAPVPFLARGETARVRFGLRCTRRGVFCLQGFRVETGFPFGLLLASRTFREDRLLVVYPKFDPLARLHIVAGRRYHPGGVTLASVVGDAFEYLGNREYREGDNLRDIDWRATARLNRPIVREYREEYFLRVAVILDTHVPGNAKPEQRAAFERAVSVAAAVSDYMARQEYLVDLFAAGAVLYHLTAGRSLAYLDQILDILACVEENREEPFEVLEPEIVENLSQITTIICVFLDWNSSRQAFVERLRQGGTGVKVIVIRDGSCTLDPALDAPTLGGIPVVTAADFRRGVEEL